MSSMRRRHRIVFGVIVALAVLCWLAGGSWQIAGALLALLAVGYALNVWTDPGVPGRPPKDGGG